ncbi:putative SP-containing protein [Vairimorpha necatrix]|uniref:SP-containing protein n=1 Tax=Vairimorpha necatrix TaxID=6039 RepID=A0AAX4JBA5_9MICR
MLFWYIVFITDIFCKKLQILLSLKPYGICTITIPIKFNPTFTGNYVYMLTEIPNNENISIIDKINFSLDIEESSFYFTYSGFGHYLKNELSKSYPDDTTYYDDKIFFEKDIIIDPTKNYYITGIYSEDNNTITNLYITSNVTFSRKKPIYYVDCLDLIEPSKKNIEPIPNYHIGHMFCPYAILEIQKISDRHELEFDINTYLNVNPGENIRN